MYNYVVHKSSQSLVTSETDRTNFYLDISTLDHLLTKNSQ